MGDLVGLLSRPPFFHIHQQNHTECKRGEKKGSLTFFMEWKGNQNKRKVPKLFIYFFYLVFVFSSSCVPLLSFFLFFYFIFLEGVPTHIRFSLCMRVWEDHYRLLPPLSFLSFLVWLLFFLLFPAVLSGVLPTHPFLPSANCCFTSLPLFLFSFSLFYFLANTLLSIPQPPKKVNVFSETVSSTLPAAHSPFPSP